MADEFDMGAALNAIEHRLWCTSERDECDECKRGDECSTYLREAVELRERVEQGWSICRRGDRWLATLFVRTSGRSKRVAEHAADSLPDLLAAIRAEEESDG